MTLDFAISERVADNATDLLAEGRVRLATWEHGRVPGAVVLGRTSDYHVFFWPDGVTCDCRAGSDHGPTEPRCSHSVAAMVIWAEHLRAAEAIR